MLFTPALRHLATGQPGAMSCHQPPVCTTNPARSYQLYAKHPLWRRAIGKHAAAAALALERCNSGAAVAGRAEAASLYSDQD